MACVTLWNASLGIGNVFPVSWNQGNELGVLVWGLGFFFVFGALNLRVESAFFVVVVVL